VLVAKLHGSIRNIVFMLVWIEGAGSQFQEFEVVLLVCLVHDMVLRNVGRW